ncbi:flagellin [Paracoccus sp. AK26]|uniref:flagellin N-terminal helical domain-containing protein n=1 Tax=Paracoccus sp. AK26 TaxID=2589076 RepID=UPI0014287DF5|nr:flagellin [Paracoccus sp. AK26]QIR86114.1 flagellin [Paracoccus sp. AK26]
MSSILTNNGAIVALQTLKNVNSSLNKAQSEISTGKSINNAQDNAAIWAVSKIMETDQSANKTIQSMLNVAGQTVATARVGAEEVGKLLTDIKNLAIGAASSTTEPEKAKITNDINLKFEQIAAVISGTQMNGVNLLKSATAPAGELKVLGSLDRAAGTAVTTKNMITVDNVGLDTALNLDLTTGATTSFTATTLDTDAARQTFIGAMETAISSVVAKTAELGSAGKRITDQADFVGKLADSLKQGIGSLVDADMEEASARLQALQTQQQLGIQALSIANQAPSAILSLFR